MSDYQFLKMTPLSEVWGVGCILCVTIKRAWLMSGSGPRELFLGVSLILTSLRAKGL